MNAITAITQTLIKRSSYPLLFLLGAGSLQGAVVIFDAIDGDPLDGGVTGVTAGPGTVQFDTTTGSTVSVTTIEIVGYDAATSSFVSALGIGAPTHETNIQATNSAFGVNSASTPPGAGNDSRDFDNGEQWTIVFSEPIEFVELDLGGQSAGEVFQVSSPAFTTFTLADGPTNDIHDMGNVFVAAGTPITFEAVAGTGIRISQFSVDVVPEPSSALLGLLGVALGFKRRR